MGNTLPAPLKVLAGEARAKPEVVRIGAAERPLRETVDEISRKAITGPMAGPKENRSPKPWAARNRVSLLLLGAWTCLAALLFALNDTGSAAGFGAVWLLGFGVVVVVWVMREAQARERGVNESLFRELFDGAPVAYHELDRLGIIQRVNRAECALLGYQEQELLGRPIWDFIAGPDRDESRLALDAKLTGKQPLLPFRRRYLRRDGSEMVLWIHDNLVRGRRGAITGIRSALLDITERLRSEEALRESQEVLHGVLNAAPVRIFWKDRNLVYLGCNTPFARDVGFEKPEDIVGKDDLAMSCQEQAERYRADDRAVIESGVARLLFDEQQTTPSGERIHLLTSKLPLRDASGVIVGVMGTYYDITQRRRTEEALRESEERLRTILRTAMDGFWLVDTQGRLLEVNEAYCRMSGYSVEELLAMRIPDLEDGEAADCIAAHMERILAQGEDRFESRQRRKDGSVFDAEVSVQYRSAGGGQCVAFVRDITERKRTAETLLRSNTELEQQLASLEKAEGELRAKEYSLSESQRIAHVGSWSWELPMATCVWTPESYRLFGVSPDTFVPTAEMFLSLIHPGDRAAMQAWISACLAGEEPPDLEFRVNLRDGGVRYILGRGHLVRDAENQPIRMVGIAQDITERRLTEAALRESEEQFRTMTAAAQDAIVMADDGLIVFWNAAAVRIFGYPREEAVGQDVRYLLTPIEAQEEFQRAFPQLIEKGLGQLGNTVEVVARRKDGTKFPVELSLSSWYRKDRWRILGIARDITGRKRAEEEVRRANEKLSTLVQKLKMRGVQESALSDMRTFLQACSSTREIAPIIEHSMRTLFPGSDGALFLLSPSKTDLETAVRWGGFPEDPDENVFSPDACWGLRRGSLHVVDDAGSGLICPHMKHLAATAYACMPLSAKSDVLGLLLLRSRPAARPEEAREMIAAVKDISSMLSELLSLSISNIRLTETLRMQSIRDPLTGLFNRRFMDEYLQREIWRASRKGRQIGVVMADIDHFKQFNDVYGHGAGDCVLSAFGNLVNTQIRGSDIACRFGGEEFVFIMPEATAEDAARRANELREAVESLKLAYGGRELGPITISMGVAAYPDGGTKPEEVLKAADAALYKAKLAGRNRVVVHG